MTTFLMQTVNERMQQALVSGVLQPIMFHAQQIRAQNHDFYICWVPALSTKVRGNPLGFVFDNQNSNNNPFLPPDPLLTVGRLGDYHHVILNKYPVCEQHLVIPRIKFADQRSPLLYEDFLALSLLLGEFGGLGFYNGGPQAGASQHHLHLQWLPESTDNASLLPFTQGLDKDLILQAQYQRSWSFEHVFVYVPPSEEGQEYARWLYQGYQLACELLGLKIRTDGFMPAMNLLIQDGWMLVVPRSQAQIEPIRLNALCFAGRIYVSELEHIEYLRQQGIIKTLAAVTTSSAA